MSIPPPPNPYASEPPPPQGPYGGQPGPPPGPFGPYPPRPAPHQAPYGPGPYAPSYPPPPYGWAGPPPKKRRVGLVLGIVGGALGAVVALVVVLVLIGRAAVGGFPEAEYRLTLPKTLADGRYALAQDLSDTQGRQIEDEADGAWDAKDLRAVVGQYNVGGDNTKGLLLFSGMYGRFKNTHQMRDHMLHGATQADGVTLLRGPKDFPKDGGPTIGCEVLRQEKMGAAIVYPVCAWGDGNTGAAIGVTDENSMTQDASDIDLASYAEFTRQVRADAVEPIG